MIKRGEHSLVFIKPQNSNPYIMKTIAFISFCFLSVVAFSQDDSRSRYINKFKEIAILEMERSGIPASIKLAQGILESAAGDSELARKANNHFGIKCGGSWDGKKYYKKDDDYNDRGELIKSCFRSYKNAESSYIAHSEFLRDPKKQYRYGFLFRLEPTDYKAWAKGLKSAGYATSATYPRKLIDIIERYQLDRYDKMTVTDPIVDVEDPVKEDPDEDNTIILGSVFKNNDVRYVLASKGETISDIAIRTGVSLSGINKYNDGQIGRNEALKEGTVVYLQTKRRSFRGKRKWHYVKPGENMFGISQLYGITLGSLYSRNKMSTPQQPAVGERLKIRGSSLKTPPVLASETPPIDDGFDEEDIIVPDEDNDGELDMEEDDFGDEPKEDKEPLIPIPDLDNDKEPEPPTPTPDEEDKDEVVTPPTTDPDDGFDDNPMEEDEFDEEEEDTGNTTEEEIKEDPVTPPPPPPVETHHTVAKGDTLYNISRRYDLTVDELKRLNNLSSNIIHIGQKLKVK